MSLKEDVFLTHASNGGDNAGISRVIHAIQHVQAEFLMLRQWANFHEVVERRFREFMRIDIAAVRAEGDEIAWVLETQMPGTGRSHRHAAENNATPVDAVSLANVVNRFENIRLARPTVAILYAS